MEPATLEKDCQTKGRSRLKISVVIPTYNRAESLQAALRSVILQTYPVHEIVVVDDGSTDETPLAVEQLAQQAKSCNIAIRLIRQSQRGAGSARNAGTAATTGDWIAFLDSDDSWHAEKLELQANALLAANGKVLACVTNAGFVNNPGLPKSAFDYAGFTLDKDFNEKNFCVLRDATKRVAYGYHGLYLQALIVARDLFLRIGGFDPDFVLCEDSDFLLRLSLNTQIALVPRVLVQIDRTPNRENGLLEIARIEAKRYGIQKELYEKWLERYTDLDEESKALIRKRLHAVHSGLASVYLLNHNFDQARNALGSAMVYGRSNKVLFKWLLTRLSPSLARAFIIRQRAGRAEEPFK